MSIKVWIAVLLVIVVGGSGFWYFSQQPMVEVKDVTLGSKTISERQSGTLSFRVESNWNLPDGTYNVELKIEAPELLSFYVAGVGELRRSGSVWSLPLGKLVKPFNMPVALMVRAGRLPAMTTSVTSSIIIKIYLGGQLRNAKTIDLTVSKVTVT